MCRCLVTFEQFRARVGWEADWGGGGLGRGVVWCGITFVLLAGDFRGRRWRRQGLEV